MSRAAPDVATMLIGMVATTTDEISLFGHHRASSPTRNARAVPGITASEPARARCVTARGRRPRPSPPAARATDPALGCSSHERRFADLTIAALNKQVIHESQNVAQGSAGACYGDSGGPTFATIDSSWTILGVTSTGDIPCWATNTASRIDRASVLSFLAGVR